MIKKNLISLYIFLLVMSVSLSLPAVTPAEYDLDKAQSTFLSIIFQKFSEAENSCSYSFKNHTGDFFWNDRKINLSLEGKLIKEQDKWIINIDKGIISQGQDNSEEFSMYAVLADQTLTITYFQSKEFVLSGQILLKERPEFDLNLDIKGLSLKKLNKTYGLNLFPFEGDFRGKVQIKGSPGAAFIKGTMEAYEGRLEEFEFKQVILNLEGFYPEIELFNSYAIAENIRFDLDGRLNLSNFLNFSPDAGLETAYTNIENIRLAGGYTNKKIITKAPNLGFLTLTDNNQLLYKLNKGGFLRIAIPGFEDSGMQQRFPF